MATGTAAAATAQGKKPQLQAFRYGTTRRRIPILNTPVVLGQAIPTVVLPQVGLLGRIVIDIEGTYTKANASGFANLDGYDALISRATVSLNNGAAVIVQLSGVGINIINQDLTDRTLPIKRGLITTAGAQAFSYKFILPINANDRRQFEMGLINLQAPEVRCNLDVTFNTLAGIFATPADVTNFLATMQVSYEYWTIPDPTRYNMPPLTLVRTIEEAPVPIIVTGDQTYQIPRMGTLMDWHAVLVLAGVYTTVLSKLTQWQWRYNKSNVQYNTLIGDQETYESDLYRGGPGNTFLNPSAVSQNFWDASDRQRNGGDLRDCIDTEENTTTENIATIAVGTTLTPGRDNFFYVRRILQKISTN